MEVDSDGGRWVDGRWVDGRFQKADGWTAEGPGCRRGGGEKVTSHCRSQRGFEDPR